MSRLSLLARINNTEMKMSEQIYLILLTNSEKLSAL